jgi:hypothetical protein
VSWLGMMPQCRDVANSRSDGLVYFESRDAVAEGEAGNQSQEFAPERVSICGGGYREPSIECAIEVTQFGGRYGAAFVYFRVKLG